MWLSGLGRSRSHFSRQARHSQRGLWAALTSSLLPGGRSPKGSLSLAALGTADCWPLASILGQIPGGKLAPGAADKACPGWVSLFSALNVPLRGVPCHKPVVRQMGVLRISVGAIECSPRPRGAPRVSWAGALPLCCAFLVNCFWPCSAGFVPGGCGRGLAETPRRVGTSRPRVVTWLILPVVICLSQRLSHACLSISNLYGETANGSLNQLSFI